MTNYATCLWTDQFVRAGDGVWIDTVGIRNPLGTGGVQYFFGDGNATRFGPVEDGLAILFTPGYRLLLPLIRR